MISLRTILYPTDFSEVSQQAFCVACALARDHGACLIVLHVLTPPPLVTFGEMEKVFQQEGGYRQLLERKLAGLRPPGGGVGVVPRLADGDPAAEIIHVAREVPCDLIVIGTHGRTGLDRFLAGSVAEQVLRKAPCPVLTVKAPFPSRTTPSSPQAQGAGSG
jgi:nucleotide-binding universal stress UspA family protein